MQPDGNLVVYPDHSSGAIWDSATSGCTGAYATIQPDGNLVVYQGAQAKWDSVSQIPRPC